MNEIATYISRDDAIQAEIIKPIEASGVVDDAIVDYDIDAIADEVLGDYDDGYACTVDPEEFWEIVNSHEFTEGDYRIVWEAPDKNFVSVAHLLRRSSDEWGWVEVDSEPILTSEVLAPYGRAEEELEARNGLHNVKAVWRR